MLCVKLEAFFEWDVLDVYSHVYQGICFKDLFDLKYISALSYLFFQRFLIQKLSHACQKFIVFYRIIWAYVKISFDLGYCSRFTAQRSSNLYSCFKLINFQYFNINFFLGQQILVQKIKIFSLSCNLVLRLIGICRNQWRCSLFPFSTEKNPFGANLVQKINHHFKLKFGI